MPPPISPSPVLTKSPNETVLEIFQPPYSSYIPPTYFFTLFNDNWAKDFFDFLRVAPFDMSTVPEEDLIYMALLYYAMNKGDIDWSAGSFRLSKTDALDASLDLIFTIPKGIDGEGTVMMTYRKDPGTYIHFETTIYGLSFGGPVSLLSYVIPDKEINVFTETFEYEFTEGAYKGNGADFSLVYLIHSPADPLAAEKIFYEESVHFTLNSGEELDMSFTGEFELPVGLRVDPLDDFLKDFTFYLANAQTLDFSFGGSQVQGADMSVIVVGFGDPRDEIASLRQHLKPPPSGLVIPGIGPSVQNKNAEYAKIIIDLVEGIGFQDKFIDKNQPIEQQSFDTYMEAKRAASDTTDSRGYTISKVEGKFIVHFLTSADLIWLAKRLRDEETGKHERYKDLNERFFIDVEFYELPYESGTLMQDKLVTLQFNYFTNLDNLKEYSLAYQGMIYQLPSGFYGSSALSIEDTKKFWLDLDNSFEFPDKYVLGNVVVQLEAIFASSDQENIRSIIFIDQRHYRGQAKFDILLSDLNNAKDPLMLRKLIKAGADEDVYHYLTNEFLRPNDWNPEQSLRKKLESSSDTVIERITDIAWGMVASKVEQEAEKRMQEMLTFLQLMEENEPLMENVLFSLIGAEGEDKIERAKVFTADEDKAKKLAAIFTKDNAEKINNLLTDGAEVDGFTIALLAENLKASRIELEETIAERKDVLSKDTIPYESLFVIQKSEMGTELRKYAYDALGFDLDPAQYPHEQYVNADWTTLWLPSPLDDDGKDYTSLLEQLYINRSVDLHRQNKALNTVKTVAIVTSVFSLARGVGMFAVARAGISTATAAGVVKAFLLEALVTSAAVGIMMEGIKVAMGGSFSLKSLLLTTGEAFAMMVVFGGINKFLPGGNFLKFSANALMFIGYGVGRYYLEHDKWPTGFDFGLIVFESILLMTLLHIATQFTDPFYRRALKMAPADGNLQDINLNLKALNQKVAAESAKPNPSRSKIKAWGELYMENIRAYRKWLVANESKFGKREYNGELQKVDNIIVQWENAKLRQATELRPAGQSESVYFYKPGRGSTKALIERFGKENVQVDKKTGLAKVTTPSGEMKLIPEIDPAKAGEKLTDIFGNNVRMMDLGVYAIRPGYKNTVARHFLKQRQSGEWIDMGDGVYVARYKTSSGESRQLTFMEEASTSTIKTALAAEAQLPGSGIIYFEKILTSESARRGFAVLKTQLSGRSNKRLLEEIEAMQEIAHQDSKSVYQALEELHLESLTRMDKVSDLAQLQRIMSGNKLKNAAQLEDLLKLDKIENAAQLESILDKVESGDHIKELTDLGLKSKKINELMDKIGDSEKLISIIRQLGQSRVETLWREVGSRSKDAIKAIQDIHTKFTPEELKVLYDHLGSDTAINKIGEYVTLAEKGKNAKKVIDMVDNLKAEIDGAIAGKSPLKANSIILDSNAMIALERLLGGESWAELGLRFQNTINTIRRIQGLLPLTSDPPGRTLTDIIGPTDVRNANIILGEIGPNSKIPRSGLELTVSRDSQAYKDVLAELNSKPEVGGPGGAADRAMIADALFAKSSGNTPSLVTRDGKRVYARLAQKYEPAKSDFNDLKKKFPTLDAVKIVEKMVSPGGPNPDGYFTITIKSQSLRIYPVFGN